VATALWIVVALLVALHLYREWWARRELPRVHDAHFDGELLRVGQTVIARRAARGDSTRSIVCFPGFLEDMRFFQALYADTDGELILVNNADYHSPFPAAAARQLDWPQNPHPLGSIEHDGFWLGHVVAELAGGAEVVLHGHSRGGAVVLEAGRQYPQLMVQRRVAAVLEAPVLPGARAAGRGSEPLYHAIACYLMPIVLGLSRRQPRRMLQKNPMMRPATELKWEIVSGICTVARHYATCVANVRSIQRWQLQTSDAVYDNYAAITVVIGERDDVLDNATMLASAERGAARNPGVRVLRTQGTNHFITLERPEYLRELLSGTAGA